MLRATDWDEGANRCGCPTVHRRDFVEKVRSRARSGHCKFSEIFGPQNLKNRYALLPKLKGEIRRARRRLSLRGGFRGFIRGVNDDLAFFAHADAFGADTGDVFEGEMHDAALARGHGVEAERLPGAFDALGSDFGGHAEFFEAQGAVAAAIDVNFFVEGGLEAESAECEMLDGFQHLSVSFEQDFFVAAVEVGDDFGVAFHAGVFGGDGVDVYFEL